MWWRRWQWWGLRRSVGRVKLVQSEYAQPPISQVLPHLADMTNNLKKAVSATLVLPLPPARASSIIQLAVSETHSPATARLSKWRVISQQRWLALWHRSYISLRLLHVRLTPVPSSTCQEDKKDVGKDAGARQADDGGEKKQQ